VREGAGRAGELEKRAQHMDVDATLVQVSELEREVVVFDYNSPLGGGSTFTSTSPSPYLSPPRSASERGHHHDAADAFEFEFEFRWS